MKFAEQVHKLQFDLGLFDF